MYRYKWWHKFVRRQTKPIPEDTAYKWKKRLSIAYAILAWNAFGLVIYQVSKGKADWAHYHGLKSDEEHAIPPAQQWARTLGIKNAKVYRISGIQKVDEYDIVNGEKIDVNKSNIESEEFDNQS